MDFSVEPNDRVPFEIRHADEDFLVVEKPSGVVTQPGKKHEHDSLLNGLFCQYGKRLQNLGESRGWGLLHRLDKDSSGLLIVAISVRGYEHILGQFKQRAIRKVYWAIVAGTPKPAQSVIQKPILEVVGRTKRAVIDRKGKQAITAYRILQVGEGVSLIEARPKTGRLHQIRLHMATHGFGILGDSIYGERKGRTRVPRLCLHAASLSFLDPKSGHRITVKSSWPQDLLRTLKRFGFDPPG